MMDDKDIEEYHKMIDSLTKKTYQPLPDSLYIGDSKIHGQGLIAKYNISQGTDLGVSHYRKGDDVIRTPLGGFINHSEEPNMIRKQIRIEPYWDKWTVTTTKDIKKGEELTLKYTMYRVDNADQMCYNKTMKNIKNMILGIIALGSFFFFLAITLNLLQGTL